MSRPVVSVLMTAFNRAAHIEAALESVLASEFTDFEVVVVDDNSTDGTHSLAERIAARDARVRVHRNERNLGDYPNRNRAAALARGTYLKYVDSDDLLYPHGLGVMVGSMRRFPAAALGISRGPSQEFPYPVELSPEDAYRRHYLAGGLLGHGPLGTIIRADAFRLVGGFSGRRYVGDIELWLQLAARFPVVLMAPGLTWWRRHDGQEYLLGQDGDAYPRLRYAVDVEALTRPDCPLSRAARLEALRRVRREHGREILGVVRRGRLRTALRLYRQSGLSLRQLLAG